MVYLRAEDSAVGRPLRLVVDNSDRCLALPKRVHSPPVTAVLFTMSGEAPAEAAQDAAASTVLGQTPSEILISLSDMPEVIVAAACSVLPSSAELVSRNSS